MILERWVDYVPAPGSRYRVHYVPDGHNAKPDLPIFKRALDARQNVAVGEVNHDEKDNSITADVQIFVGDMSLLSVLGRSISDGAEFWNIDYVDRLDSGVPSGFDVTRARIMDRLLDPVQTAATAGVAAVRETAVAVKRIGIPTTALVLVAVAAFFLARLRG